MKYLNLFFTLGVVFFGGIAQASTEEVPLKLNCYEKIDAQRGGVPGIAFGQKLSEFEILGIEDESTGTCRMNLHGFCGSISGTALITEDYFGGVQTYVGSFYFNFATSRIISAKLSFLSDAESMQSGQSSKSFVISSIGVHGIEPFTGTKKDAADYRKDEYINEIVCEAPANLSLSLEIVEDR